MQKPPQVASIVLNYNGGDRVFRCVEALLGGKRVPQVYLVDNASTDGSVKKIAQEFPAVTIIKNNTNLGFAAGMNVGLRRAVQDGAEYLWLMNDDATPHPEALEHLFATSEKLDRPALLSPGIITPDGNPWFFGGAFSFVRMRAIHEMPSNRVRSQQFFPSKFLTGCALFIPRAIIESIGYLDERYFLYYEDAAYSRWAKRAGYGLFVVPKAVVSHEERSELRPEKVYWLVRSGIEFFRRESPPLLRPYIEILITLRKLKNRTDLLFGRNPKIASMVRRAYTEASYE